MKLDRFGLALTADHRIVSLRSTVLDDGVGGKIVGWQNDDLAATELAPWDPSGGASAKKPDARKPPVMMASSPAPVAPAPVVSPAPPAPAPVFTPPPAPAFMAPALAFVAPPAPVAVAPAPAVAAPDVTPEEPEEDWEWEIAVARARAEALDSEETEFRASRPKLALVTDSLVKAPIANSWTQVTAKAIAESIDETTAIAEVPSPLHAVPRTTVIPIPSMPRMASDRPSYMTPVVRSAASRLAQGTMPPATRSAARAHTVKRFG
ncbi:MAG: hypothetical protein H0T89_12640 [Deltaproteobacteria bacterium]|nr:hypothetical protein [Deltaproteobacteria bacterium]MDQ3295579.1 hypothetical protein [Myxococcota bacterium]